MATSGCEGKFVQDFWHSVSFEYSAEKNQIEVKTCKYNLEDEITLKFPFSTKVCLFA